jgi:hypothetical protein
MLAFTSLAVAVWLSLSPDEFDAERAANIEHEQAKHIAAVVAKYGNKKSTELTPEARSQMIRDLEKAEKQTLEKYGVTTKEWARLQLHRTREQADQVKRAKELLQAKERAFEQHAAQKPREPTEIVIQKGISDEQPVVLEETETTAPLVERGLPSEYEKDQNAAAESDAAERAPERPASKQKTGRGKK